ncbi:phosphoribosyltransferase family protein [Actinacidiphila acididurans]|uniref:Dienelactone hydrolase family protein n=1 Tax=Actinacidiphila acididurans TaxID=2784346 RepID=A0ABS2TWM3_9ACTN|nr:phosphoribosyltransferase family protein [Actinacidiphila acididurans]MBM9506363.1 dienelactone hydrolase family protein [Actinacidiphila acididurans]
MEYRDRREAGQRLARELLPEAGPDTLVLGLPRGGVPVGEEIAGELGAPLDVCLVRKLGVPHRPELAAGAIGEGGVRVLNDDVIQLAGVSPRALADVEARERAVLDRRARAYHESRPGVDLAGRTVLVVDDGVATGATERAACQVVRARGARRVVVAAPVAPPGWTQQFAGLADACVCPYTPSGFAAIGQFYADFSEVNDAEVVACLARAAHRSAAGAAPGRPASADRERADRERAPERQGREVEIPAGRVVLPGELTVPEGAPMIVVFAHGSGSSRHSTRNRFVAHELVRAGLGTLLFDLLTPREAEDRAAVFDIPLLAARLLAAVHWLRAQPLARGRDIGAFGASTGAAAALWAAADPAADIAAVVSRGGRPDLAATRLPRVTAPTLLVVGGHDPTVLDLNRQAQSHLRCSNDLAIVPGATHLFEEPGTLPAVAELAADWFTRHPAPHPHHH